MRAPESSERRKEKAMVDVYFFTEMPYAEFDARDMALIDPASARKLRLTHP